MKQKTLFSFFTSPKEKVETKASGVKTIILTPKSKSAETIVINDDVEMEDQKNNNHVTGKSSQLPHSFPYCS